MSFLYGKPVLIVLNLHLSLVRLVPGNVLYKIELPQWQIGAAVAGIWIDGELLVDSTKPPVKIIDINPGANTITVDGGEWDASNKDEVWSNGTLVGNRNDTSSVDLFDGNMSTKIVSENTNDAFWVFTSLSTITANESIVLLTTSDGGTYGVGIGNVFKEVSLNGGTNGYNELELTNANSGITFPFTFNQIKGQRRGTFGSGVVGIRVDGKLLVDTGVSELGDTEVTCVSPLKAPTDWKVEAIEGNTLSLSHATPNDNAQVWVANDNQAGKSFYVEPTNAIPIEKDEAWASLAIVNNSARVIGIQSGEPDYLPVTAKDYSITFPSLFATGNTPDVDLPRGTCIQAIVQADNGIIGSPSEKASNCLMPADVNPDGIAGPITASTPTTVTMQSSANLDTFSPSDSLIMCDLEGNPAEYTIVSDSIVSVDSTTYDYTSYWTGTVIGKSGTTADAGMAFDDNVVSNYVYGNANQTITWTPPEPISYEDIKLYVSQSGYGGTVVVNNIDVTSAIQVYTGTTGVFFSKVQLEGLGVTSPLTSIAITSSSAQGNTPIMCGLEIDGRLLIDNDVQTTLTLSGPTDLAYFREGDVVQSEGYLGDWLAQFTAISGALTTPENAFNGIFVEDAAGTANYNAASVNSYGAIMIVDFTSGSKLPSGTVEILGYPKNFQYLGGPDSYR